MLFGGIAQLVERLNGIQKVSGSTPLTSTILIITPVYMTGFCFFYSQDFSQIVNTGLFNVTAA